ncbi:MAG: ABC transporter permease [Acidimicrobiia bacterium]
MSTIAEVVGSNDLTWNLTLRELRSRYKKSVLGWTWSLLNPLSTVIIYSVVFAFFLKIEPPVGDPSGLHNFAAFLLCGLLPWNFLSNSINGSMASLIGNANLLKKVYFPREVFVLSTIASLVITFLIELAVLAVILLVLGNMVLPWIPVVLVIVALQTVFCLGLGLMLSVLNVYFRDVQHLMSIALNALFYSAPIVYPISYVPDRADILGFDVPLGFIYRLNPIVQFVEVYRDAMYNLRFPPLLSVLYLLGWSAAMFGIGLAVFRRLEARVPEEV